MQLLMFKRLLPLSLSLSSCVSFPLPPPLLFSLFLVLFFLSVLIAGEKQKSFDEKEEHGGVTSGKILFREDGREKYQATKPRATCTPGN